MMMYTIISFVRLLNKVKIRLIYCLTTDMVTDIFIKTFPFLKVKYFASVLGLSTA